MAADGALRLLAARHAPPAVSVRVVAAAALMLAWSSLVLAHPASSWLVGESQLELEAVIPFSLGMLGLAVGIGLGRPDTWWLGAGVLTGSFTGPLQEQVRAHLGRPRRRLPRQPGGTAGARRPRRGALAGARVARPNPAP
jgi:hypothetical protein